MYINHACPALLADWKTPNEPRGSQLVGQRDGLVGQYRHTICRIFPQWNWNNLSGIQNAGQKPLFRLLQLLGAKFRQRVQFGPIRR